MSVGDRVHGVATLATVTLSGLRAREGRKCHHPLLHMGGQWAGPLPVGVHRGSFPEGVPLRYPWEQSRK